MIMFSEIKPPLWNQQISVHESNWVFQSKTMQIMISLIMFIQSHDIKQSPQTNLTPWLCSGSKVTEVYLWWKKIYE